MKFRWPALAGAICSFLTTKYREYHKSVYRKSGGCQGVTGRWLARRLVGEGRQRSSSAASACGKGRSTLRVTRLAPNETASGSNAGALSNKEKF
jgi:hypothetical protein